MSGAVSTCPIGATENSPAFQRWVDVFEMIPSLVGTAEIFDLAGSTARDFFRPYGTRFPFSLIPTVETVGYCRASLRDWDDMNAEFRTHLPPAKLAADILKKEQRIAEIMGNIQKLIGKTG